jgi:hypothetical protein
MTGIEKMLLVTVSNVKDGTAEAISIWQQSREIGSQSVRSLERFPPFKFQGALAAF